MMNSVKLKVIHDNVIKMENGDKTSDKIKSYLNRVALSGNSQTAYAIDIRQFLRITRGTELEFIKEDQVTNYSLSELEAYITYLSRDLGYTNATINRKMSAIKGIFDRLDLDGLDINIKVFNNIAKLPESDSNSYDSVTWDELVDMMLKVKEKANGEEKSLLFELAGVTSFRLNSILKLTPRSFKMRDGVWTVGIKASNEKTNKEDIKPIRTELYERLEKELFKGTDVPIFTMSDRTALRAIKEVANDIGLGEDKNVVFHSLKGCGIGEVYTLTGGDYMQTAQQGNHSSFATAQKYYMKFSKDYSKMPSLLIGQEIDLSPIEELDHEELLELIRRCDKGTQVTILNKLKG